MKPSLVVPYTDLKPEVIWALQESGHDYELVDVSDSHERYFWLLTALWIDQRSFTIVEHDIVVTAAVLDSFNVCDQPWCVAKYRYLRGVYWGLGCTRFSRSLMIDFPDLMVEVANYRDDDHPPRHWCTLDAAIARLLHRHLREWPHIHGVVDHLGNQLPTHGCRG